MPEIIITIKGKLDPSWSDWFDGLSVENLSSGDTVLHGQLPDQPAVYSILSRLSSLGCTLAQCECRESKPAAEKTA